MEMTIKMFYHVIGITFTKLNKCNITKQKANKAMCSIKI